MTQEEFNTMLATAIAMGLGGGYYTSVYSGEEIDTLLALTGYIAGDPLIDQFYIRAGQKSGVTPGTRATAEGTENESTGVVSHTEGQYNEATHVAAHSEGSNNVSSGDCAHAEGYQNTASGYYSHAEGFQTLSGGTIAHAEGQGTIANHAAQHAGGRFNIADPSSAAASDIGNYVEIIGNGTADNARSNARTLDWSGNEVLAGKLTLGAQGTGSMDAVTKGQLDAAKPTYTDISGNGDIVIS